TTAAILLAYDALYKWTPASCLFRHEYWDACESVLSTPVKQIYPGRKANDRLRPFPVMPVK
ncbi:MAG: hypothetical protein NTY16_08865, partial [Deltaproteobacteria bacterium]|nr:hypothetical protein [Deltaproteobacteria bacterium]